MSLKSRPDRYGAVAIAIHWTTAIAIFAMLGTGLVAARSSDVALTTTLLRGHAIMGIAIGVLTLLRILWWLAFDKRPQDVAGTPRPQALAAHIVHYGLYAVILVMVSSGVATMIMTGGFSALFAGAPLPEFDLAPPMTVHGLLSRGLIILVIGHIGAALYHQFVRRDRLLARMGLGA